MKRRIKILPPIAMVQLDGSPVTVQGEPAEVTFVQFVRERTCDDAFVSVEPKQGFSMDDVLAASRVCARFEEGGEHVDLEEADYERLLRATKNPRGGYHPAAARVVLPFMLAIVEAKVVDE